MTLEQKIRNMMYRSHDADCAIDEGYSCDCEMPYRLARDLAERIERSWAVLIGSEAKWTENDKKLAVAAFIGGDG